MSEKKIILGIHPGHNASALIGDEDGVQFAIQEERITRNKNEWGFPYKAIEACLAHAAVQPEEVDEVVFGSNRLVMRKHTREESIWSYARQDTFFGKIRQRILMPMVMYFRKDYGQKEAIGNLTNMGFAADSISFFDHHTSHAATAYYGLRHNTNDEYLVLTCDGSGDDLCASVRIMGPDKDEIVATTHWNNSLGALYSWSTFRMGFVPLEHEYKLMGMAPYAEERYAVPIRDVYKSFLWLDDSGLRFQRKTLQRISDVSEQLFNKLRGKRFDAVSGGLQMFTEEILSEWVRQAVQHTGIKKVLAAGGVFMNVKANKTIADLEEVEYFEAFPSCGDESLPFGAYYQAIARRLGQAKVRALNNIYTGNDITEESAKIAINNSGYSYEKPEKMADRIASLLYEGYPVARCAGRMEFGARALGNRSILADPSDTDVVRVINRMIKKRDFWMPFAPMMKKDKSQQYIHNEKDLNSPYMMMTFDTRENYTQLIAAVQQADLTCRAQLITPEQNSEMYEIIDAFESKSGRAVVLNTSFNLHGFPLVSTAQDAVNVFANSGLEFMQLGPFLLKK